MPDLFDYGAQRKPHLRKKRSMQLGRRTVGYYAERVRDGEPVYVSERDTDDHRYHGEDPWYDLPFDGDGYGLSIELFERLYAADASVVYIVEQDTGDVYQFGFQQFVDGAPINFEDEANGRGYEKDPQMVVAIEDAVEVYRDHYPAIYTKQPAFS